MIFLNHAIDKKRIEQILRTEPIMSLVLIICVTILDIDKAAITQHTHHYAIVDEIDSILIDEARTPLIISAPASESSDMYTRFLRLHKLLVEGDVIILLMKSKAIQLTEEGITKAETHLIFQIFIH
jgi:preprotein translocase subunit SecA